MYLGIYEIEGDPEDLLPAYDRVMAGMPDEELLFHACAVREHGITMYDACPTKEAFEQFSTSTEFPRRVRGGRAPVPGEDHRAAAPRGAGSGNLTHVAPHEASARRQPRSTVGRVPAEMREWVHRARHDEDGRAAPSALA